MQKCVKRGGTTHKIDHEHNKHFSAGNTVARSNKVRKSNLEEISLTNPSPLANRYNAHSVVQDDSKLSDGLESKPEMTLEGEIEYLMSN